MKHLLPLAVALSIIAQPMIASAATLSVSGRSKATTVQRVSRRTLRQTVIQKRAPAPKVAVDVSTKTPHPKSTASASITVIEYMDMQCPACSASHTLIDGPLVEKYGSSIRFEVRHFPLTTLHKYAMAAAEASECAADQGKFWEFVDMLLANQKDLNTQSIETWGKKLRLDMTAFDQCQTSHVKRALIQAEYDRGEKDGVQGTPTYFVNGKPVASDIDMISAAIDAARRKR